MFLVVDDFPAVTLALLIATPVLIVKSKGAVGAARVARVLAMVVFATVLVLAVLSVILVVWLFS